MRMRGVEPPRAKAHRHLKPARLPIPPHPQHFSLNTVSQNRVSIKSNISSFLHFVKDFHLPIINS
jgi:hypothetical protein